MNDFGAYLRQPCDAKPETDCDRFATNRVMWRNGSGIYCNIHTNDIERSHPSVWIRALDD